MNIDKQAVSRRIQTIMQHGRMTQREFATVLGISQPAVSLYLQGRLPPPEVLLSIARLGKTTVEWLLTGESASEAEPEGVRESAPPYGREGALLTLWEQLPAAVQQDVLALLRHLARTTP